ncbi:hypothetical protein D7030_14945 [Flavobacteriaceae bacterium AU392]|nr:hypothetical protein D1817_03545 [Flavobacteriaceae bacterium]RKM81592.1 hypothetical protein D7030_14945 [Flavobacteriaceae bacterium AU392]
MLKNLLKLNGIQQLTLQELSNLFGGDVETGETHKCCIRIPEQTPPPNCNPILSCVGKPCGCS